jgi:DNA helicase HerA-like ATPase
MNLSYREIGNVIADDVSPSFDVFRFKALAEEYVFPGTLVGTWISDNQFLIGRICASIEINPHESAERAKVREAMSIPADYPSEEFSINIFRVYEAEIIEEGTVKYNEKKEIIDVDITAPTNMAKAGQKVFIPAEDIISKAMGFNTEPDDSLVLGKTRITMEDEENSTNNVLLKKQIIQRHIFIGGTTGSGKSFSTGILLEEISRFKIPIIIFDSQEEYFGVASGLGGKTLTPGKDFTIKISSLTEREIAELVPTIRGTQMEELLIFTFLRLKSEGRNFSLDDILRGMETDGPQLQMQARTIQPAIRRVSYYIGRHNFISTETNLNDLIKTTPVINIDCSDLTQSQLQLVVASTLRELTNQRINKKIPPYVVVIDEAHLLVPESEDSPCKQVIRENIRIGRHYGICMILLTQSPVDIDKKTIRQCNTRFIFSLEPDQLDSIRGVKADAPEDTLKRLPKFPRGTCLLSGTYETLKHAIPVQIRSDRKTKEGGATPDIFKEVFETWKKK